MATADEVDPIRELNVQITAIGLQINALDPNSPHYALQFNRLNATEQQLRDEEARIRQHVRDRELALLQQNTVHRPSS
jgi:hypothetical protein